MAGLWAQFGAWGDFMSCMRGLPNASLACLASNLIHPASGCSSTQLHNIFDSPSLIMAT